MTAFSNYLETAILNLTLRGVPFTPPANLYAALFTVAPNEDGAGGSEVNISGYVRKEATFDAPVGNSCETSEDLEWDPATANWGNIVHIAFFDALTNGNMLYHGPLGAPKNIVTGDRFRLPAGEVSVVLD